MSARSGRFVYSVTRFPSSRSESNAAALVPAQYIRQETDVALYAMPARSVAAVRSCLLHSQQSRSTFQRWSHDRFGVQHIW